MIYEKKLIVTKEGEEKEYCYYVKRKEESEFGCVMYNVGIKGEEISEIDDFSPSEDEAKALCDYLYNENVTSKNLFLIAEEFITFLGI